MNQLSEHRTRVLLTSIGVPVGIGGLLFIGYLGENEFWRYLLGILVFGVAMYWAVIRNFNQTRYRIALFAVVSGIAIILSGLSHQSFVNRELQEFGIWTPGIVSEIRFGGGGRSRSGRTIFFDYLVNGKFSTGALQADQPEIDDTVFVSYSSRDPTIFRVRKDAAGNVDFRKRSR